MCECTTLLIRNDWLSITHTPKRPTVTRASSVIYLIKSLMPIRNVWVPTLCNWKIECVNKLCWLQKTTIFVLFIIVCETKTADFRSIWRFYRNFIYFLTIWYFILAVLGQTVTLLFRFLITALNISSWHYRLDW